MTKKIHRIDLESRRLYGSPKITQKLLREGERLSQKRVSHIMKEHQLRSLTVKMYRATTNSRHSLPVHENVRHMDSWMTNDLVQRALDCAYARHKPPTTVQTLHYSDRGSQYASLEYQDRLQKYRMTGSMSRKGNCYDNACIESFHSVIKRELIHRRNDRTRKEAST